MDELVVPSWKVFLLRWRRDNEMSMWWKQNSYLQMDKNIYEKYRRTHNFCNILVSFSQFSVIQYYVILLLIYLLLYFHIFTKIHFNLK